MPEALSKVYIMMYQYDASSNVGSTTLRSIFHILFPTECHLEAVVQGVAVVVVAAAVVAVVEVEVVLVEVVVLEVVEVVLVVVAGVVVSGIVVVVEVAVGGGV